MLGNKIQSTRVIKDIILIKALEISAISPLDS